MYDLKLKIREGFENSFFRFDLDAKVELFLDAAILDSYLKNIYSWVNELVRFEYNLVRDVH